LLDAGARRPDANVAGVPTNDGVFLGEPAERSGTNDAFRGIDGVPASHGGTRAT
jgi:hypothetical protein